MNRPVQLIKFGSIQHRPEKRSPRIVRWTVDGNPYSESFKTKPQAERYRNRLMAAADAGERFSLATGEPEAWSPGGGQVLVYDWARRWLAEQWDELAPRTRSTYATAIARFVPLAVHASSSVVPDGMYPWLEAALAPGAEVDSNDNRERWLRRWGVTLGQLDRDLLAEVDRKLGNGVSGQPLAATTANRYRKHAKACVRRAVELEKIPANPWPPIEAGRSRRKANKAKRAIDIRHLPGPEDMAAVLEALPNQHQPFAGRTWQVMSAVAYYAGLRPSEVMYLRPNAMDLPYMPGGGWGRVNVTEADDGDDNAASTKTGTDRSVPIPPQLTQELHAFFRERPPIAPDALLFRTQKGTRPPINNWRRALTRACTKAGATRLTPYDLRHAAATTWLQAGVPLGEAAQRLGHSVATLVSHYIQALTGDVATANARIEQALGAPVPRLSRESDPNSTKQTEQRVMT